MPTGRHVSSYFSSNDVVAANFPSRTSFALIDLCYADAKRKSSAYAPEMPIKRTKRTQVQGVPTEIYGVV